MSKAQTTPVEIDTAIAEQMIKVTKAELALQSLESLDPIHVKWERAMRALEADVQRLNDLRALYTGWTRYYHVTNTNGHVHTSTTCPSCEPTTQFAWRTDLSGLTVEQVVEREAHNACTVCMPIAPAEQRAAREYRTKVERERKAAEKAQVKREKELAKVPRAHTLAIKVNELFDTFEGQHGEDGAYRALYLEHPVHGKRFHKGYENAYFVYSDILEQRNRKAAR